MTRGCLVGITSNTQCHVGSGIPCSPRLTSGEGMDEETGDNRLERSAYAKFCRRESNAATESKFINHVMPIHPPTHQQQLAERAIFISRARR